MDALKRKSSVMEQAAVQGPELSLILLLHTVPGLVSVVEWQRGNFLLASYPYSLSIYETLACPILEVPMSRGLEFNNGGRKKIGIIYEVASMISDHHTPGWSYIMLIVLCRQQPLSLYKWL